jgi:hypothetical protein
MPFKTPSFNEQLAMSNVRLLYLGFSPSSLCYLLPVIYYLVSLLPFLPIHAILFPMKAFTAKTAQNTAKTAPKALSREQYCRNTFSPPAYK